MQKRAVNDALFNLADALAADIARTSEEELLAEVAEDHGSTRAFSIIFDKIIERTVEVRLQIDAGDARLAGLKRYLTDAKAPLGADVKKLLAADPGFLKQFRQMMTDLASHANYIGLPRAAAASDGDLHERRFDRGYVRLVQSQKDPLEIYVVIEFDNTTICPQALVLSSPSGEVTKLRMEAADDEGVAQMLLDIREGENKRIIELLRNPLVAGLFI